MRILEIGVGAVGKGLAIALAAGGATVDLIARPETASAIRTRGLYRTGVLGDLHIQPEHLGVYTDVRELPDRSYDFVLISTKAYDVNRVASELAGNSFLISPDTRIVLFCNGIGCAETLAARFAPEQIYCARVITGFQCADPATVEVTVHAGPIAIGNPFTREASRTALLCERLTAGGLPARPCPEIQQEIWAKVLFNCAVNAPGALFDRTIGELASEPKTRALMEQVIEEVFAVMSLAGYRTRWASAGEYLPEFYGRLIPATAGHRSSMSQDLRLGRRTEIDFLNGAIARMGRCLGVGTPANTFLTRAIRTLQAVAADPNRAAPASLSELAASAQTHNRMHGAPGVFPST